MQLRRSPRKKYIKAPVPHPVIFHTCKWSRGTPLRTDANRQTLTFRGTLTHVARERWMLSLHGDPFVHT